MHDELRLFVVPEGTTKEAFKAAAPDLLMARYDSAWILEAPNPKNRAVGVLFGAAGGDLFLIGDLTWFPWATRRNKLETMVAFFQGLRKTTHAIFTVEHADRGYYDHIAAHAVIRRVGTMYHRGRRMALFETRDVDGGAG